MIKKLLPLCLVSVACTPAPPDPRGVARDEVLLQVSASGRADARPDEARFTAGVQTIAATAAEASAGNSATMNKVTSALEQLGIGADDLQTRSISMSRIDYGPQRGRFQANNMVEVRVRKIDSAGAVIAATTQAGANVLSGPNLTIADPEAVSRSAYAQAYRAARQRADAYAQAAGLKVSRVLAIRDTGDSGGPRPYYGDGVMAEQAAPPPVVAPPVRAGVTTSEVRVRADFALAKK